MRRVNDVASSQLTPKMHKMKTCTHTESGTALAMDKRVKVNTVDYFAPNFFYRFVGIFILKEH